MKTKPNGYWTKENVFAEARKYRTKKNLKKVVVVLMLLHVETDGCQK